MTNEAEIEALLEDTNRAATGMKIAVILRDDLEMWQKLNVTAFTISGVASQAGAVGALYHDASRNRYLPMFKDPVLVFSAPADSVMRTCCLARASASRSSRS